MATKELYVNDFSAGLITKFPPHLIPHPGASALCENWDLSEKVGALVRRKGRAVHKTALASSDKVSGLFQYVQADGDTFLIASNNDDVYNVTGAGTWTSIFTGASMDGSEVNFSVMNDLLVIVNATITTQKWAGTGATAALLGTPPANVKYIEKHANRMWMANSSAGKSRLHYSALDDVEDWTDTGDDGAGFIDVYPDDGEEITGIKSLGNILLVWKRTRTFAVYNYKPSNFIVRELSPSVGCVANKTIVKTDTQAIFLSLSDVYFASIGGVVRASDAIKPSLLDLTTAAKEGAAAGHLNGQQYWLCYDSDADSDNDVAFVLDYVNGIWSKYTNIEANVFMTDRNGDLFSGGADDVVIRQHHTGTDDEGSAITATWKSKSYDFDTFVNEKFLYDLWLHAKAISSINVTVDVFLNGVDQSYAKTISLTATDPTSAAEFVTFRQHLLSSFRGHLFQIQLKTNQTGTRPEIQSFSVLYEMSERES